MTWAHLDLKAGSVPLIDPTSPNVNPETRPRIDGKAEIIPPSTPSNIDPTINVGASIEISTGSDSHPDEESTLYQLLFDFKSFLEGGDLDDVFGITPGYTSEGGKWEIAKLSGGFMNVTVRVLPPHGDDKNPRSVVIKYAPPFMAAMGQDAPFGTFRQVVEYRALDLLGSTPSVTSAEAAYGVAIPRALKFFQDESVLVIQDLGKWMIPLEPWMYPPTAESPPSLETCISVGARLGAVLASIHCDPALLLKSQELADDGKLWFENPDTKGLLQVEVLDKIIPILRPRVNPATDTPEKIANIISRDSEHPFINTLHLSSVPKLMFSTGDLWTGSILIGTPPTASDSNDSTGGGAEVEIGLIDWEFASPARIGQDIAQLSACLYLFSTSSAWSSTEPRYRRVVTDTTAVSSTPGVGPDLFRAGSGPGVSHGVSPGGRANPVTGETLGLQSSARALLNALLDTYACKVKEYPDYAWLIDEDYGHRGSREERLAVIRSIWILFGRDIIYNAVELEARFEMFFTVEGDKDEEEIKMWQKEMTEFGCWYVLVAGESTDEEFEEAVRKECVLKRMYYTGSASL